MMDEKLHDKLPASADSLAKVDVDIILLNVNRVYDACGVDDALRPRLTEAEMVNPVQLAKTLTQFYVYTFLPDVVRQAQTSTNVVDRGILQCVEIVNNALRRRLDECQAKRVKVLTATLNKAMTHLCWDARGNMFDPLGENWRLEGVY